MKKLIKCSRISSVISVIFWCTSILVIFNSCSQKSKVIKGESAYTRGARISYDKAMDAFEDEAFIEAEKQFNIVKNKYPYSKYATLSELRIADCHFESGNYIETIDAFEMFIKFHPNNEEIPYALFKIGMAHYNQIPSELWFLLPPQHEKEQISTVRTVESMQYLLNKFPKSKYTKQAKEKLAECRRKLADHEIYVANFYLKRKHYKAVINRLNYLLEKYSNLGLDEEAMYKILYSNLKLGNKDEADKYLKLLNNKFPDSKFTVLAKKNFNTVKLND